MKLEFVGKDPESKNDGSPTVYRCPERQSWVLQGYKIDGETRAKLEIPEHEDAIEMPYRMLRFMVTEG